MYSADIEFRYQVGGQSYSTKLRHFGQIEGSGDSSEAEVLRYRYPPDAVVTVSYSPANPSIATAEPGFDLDALWLPGAGLAFAFPAVMFSVLWFGMSRESERGFAIGLGMFASIFATIGFIMLASGFTNLWRAWQSPYWPQTKGIIVYGQIDQSQSVTGQADGSTQSAVSSGTHIVYRYEVDGHVFFSNVRRFGQLVASSDDLAMQVAARYPLHREVSVAYSPGNASLSALETGLASEAYWLPGAGAACFLFAMAVLICGIPALTRQGPGL
jgi:hypothetical protein